MALDFTFLKAEQVWGNQEEQTWRFRPGALDVMKLYGGKVAQTDLAIILGGWVTCPIDHTSLSHDGPACISWTASPYSHIYSVEGVYRTYRDEDVHCLCDEFGCKKGSGYPAFRRGPSARPALPPSEASKISPSNARTNFGICVAEYGQYPQKVADERTSEKLERLHALKSLHPTGKNYTFDSVDPEDCDTPFKAMSVPEYEMDGKRYIRVLGRPSDSQYSTLSTREQVKDGKPYWVEVQPIEWLVDKTGWMIAKKCLFAGIQFDTKKKYDGDFSKTFMKHYLDTYFAKEMMPIERVVKHSKTKIGNVVSRKRHVSKSMTSQALAKRREGR